MAGKARRAASRQGQLKRKKHTMGPTGIPSTDRKVTVPETLQSENSPANSLESTDNPEHLVNAEGVEVPSVARSVSGRTPRGEVAAHGQGRLRGERPAAYLYVGAEFRRILMLTGAVLAALIVLGIVL